MITYRSLSNKTENLKPAEAISQTEGFRYLQMITIQLSDDSSLATWVVWLVVDVAACYSVRPGQLIA
jgi:hypothetical protein